MTTVEQKPVTDPITHRPLRAWPALLLVIVILALRFGVNLLKEPPNFLVMLLGPLIACLLLIVWWLFFSRGLWRERLLGLLGLLTIAVGTFAISDPSMLGFGSMMFAIPVGFAAFAVGLVLKRSDRPKVRTTTALVAALIGFGVWDLARTDGVWGDYHANLYWRWTPTAEELFLASRASENDGDAQVQAPIKSLPKPEWPGFRGPHRNGVVDDLVLGTDWDQSPPIEKWRIRLGPGWSSFAVAGDWLFTQEQRGTKEAVVCYNAGTGKQRWAHEYDARFWEAMGGAGPRATPTLAGGRLYALGAAGMLVCLDPKSGDVHWRGSLAKDADRKPPQWGFSSSPLVVGNSVIVHAGGNDDKGIFAYDATTGGVLWSAPAGDHSYSSVQVSKIAGRVSAVMLTNTGFSVVDPISGKELLNYETKVNGYRVLQPLLIDESSLLVAAQNGTSRVRLSAKDDALVAEEVWHSRSMKPDFSDFVAFENHLYGIDGKALACINLANGEKRWKKGRYGKGQLLLLPQGRQLLVASEMGEIVLLKANPDRHEELAKMKVFNGKTWNHPVLVDNRLFLRNAEEAICLEMPMVRP